LWRTILRIDFYHLTQIPLERALPAIAERVVEAGQRLAIVAEDTSLLTQLDEALWTYKADSFLPHGRSGDQPILLCAPGNAPASHENIALVDGVWRDTALNFARVFYFFDETNVEAARAAWRALAARDETERHYWKQNDAGKWGELG
jgi:DNA polymerase III subunit chi